MLLAWDEVCGKPRWEHHSRHQNVENGRCARVAIQHLLPIKVTPDLKSIEALRNEEDFYSWFALFLTHCHKY